MHQIAARNAIRPVLTQLFPELVDTIERHAKIEKLVWGIVKSIDESGLRFVDYLEKESQLSDLNCGDVSVPARPRACSEVPSIRFEPFDKYLVRRGAR